MIKNKEEYLIALSYIESLMASEPNTEELEKLKVWTALVERYEDKEFPINPPTALEAIKFHKEQLKDLYIETLNVQYFI